MTFEIYKDKAGEYRWRLVSSNGRIVADSAEGYKRKDGARKAVLRAKVEIGVAPIEDCSAPRTLRPTSRQ